MQARAAADLVSIGEADHEATVPGAGRRDLLLATTILLVGAALRCAGLGTEALWNDEGHTWWWAGQPLRDLWGTRGAAEHTPPLYYSLQHLWLVAFGSSEVALRSLSALLGTLTIPLTYLVGRMAGGRGVGLLAAALLATSPVHVYYSQEARTYALLCAATTVAVLGLLRFLGAYGDPPTRIGNAGTRPVERPTPNLTGLGLYALGATVALYSHNTAVLLPALANLVAAGWWLGPARRDRRFLAAWVLANLVPLATWLWWIPVILAQSASGASAGWIGQPSLTQALYDTVRLYGLRYATKSLWPLQVTVVPFLLLLGAFAVWRRARIALVLAAFVAGVPAATYVLGLAVTPLWEERTLLWALPLGLVLIASAILALHEPRLRYAVLIAVLGAQVVDLGVYYTRTLKAPFDDVAQVLAGSWRQGDGILLVPETTQFALSYYLSRRGHPLDALGLDPVPKDAEAYAPYRAHPLAEPAGRPVRPIAPDDLGALPDCYRRMWVVLYRPETVDPANVVLHGLQAVGQVVGQWSFRPHLGLALVGLEHRRRESGRE
jgi:hypothetical protein